MGTPLRRLDNLELIKPMHQFSATADHLSSGQQQHDTDWQNENDHRQCSGHGGGQPTPAVQSCLDPVLNRLDQYRQHHANEQHHQKRFDDAIKQDADQQQQGDQRIEREFFEHMPALPSGLGRYREASHQQGVEQRNSCNERTSWAVRIRVPSSSPPPRVRGSERQTARSRLANPPWMHKLRPSLS
mgnify:CR=1 FL=1